MIKGLRLWDVETILFQSLVAVIQKQKKAIKAAAKDTRPRVSKEFAYVSACKECNMKKGARIPSEWKGGICYLSKSIRERELLTLQNLFRQYTEYSKLSHGELIKIYKIIFPVKLTQVKALEIVLKKVRRSLSFKEADIRIRKLGWLTSGKTPASTLRTAVGVYIGDKFYFDYSSGYCKIALCPN